ncbi:MAG: LptF/LptG family permease [Pirellulaceae bacterium]|nr:LptF/LptG family permease [Pirellulaceae bacterium]
MRLIDRYVFFVFAKVFLLCFLCLTGIYVVGDFVGNLNEFIDASDQHGGLFITLGRYYAIRVPWFFDLIGRIVALISAVFTVTWLQRHNEMTALMAAGLSRWRILRPVIAGVMIVTVLSIANRELVIPDLREELSQKVRDWTTESATPLSAHFDHMTDILIDGEKGIEKERQIINPAFRLPLSMSYFSRQLVASSANRQPATPELPAGYLLNGVTSPKKIDELDGVRHDGRTLIYTRRDAPWLEPSQCFVVSDVTFGQLTGGRAWRQFASTKDLITGLSNPSMNFGADVRVAVHSRLVQPLLDLTLLFLGLPVVLAKESRNVFIAAGSCVAIVVIFFIVTLAAQNLGANYLLAPALAAWLPLMLFVPWAVASSNPLRR